VENKKLFPKFVGCCCWFHWVLAFVFDVCVTGRTKTPWTPWVPWVCMFCTGVVKALLRLFWFAICWVVVVVDWTWPWFKFWLK
jgi:hypothetical protein